MGELAALSREHAWTERHRPRYRFGNHVFARGDALALYGILRRFQPAQVVEVGSGFSSALMLDTDEVHLGGRTPFTFIDPYPERLHGLLSDADRDRVTVIENRAELLDPKLFADLGPGDMLFIDSSHVSRIGSDVASSSSRCFRSCRPECWCTSTTSPGRSSTGGTRRVSPNLGQWS
jgi:hypothetical protein